MPLGEVFAAAASTGRDDFAVNGLPTWARAILILGPTAAIAIYLVWVGANQMPAIAAQVKQNHVEILRNREATDQFLREQQAQTRTLVWICVNTAKDDNARKSCFEK